MVGKLSNFKKITCKPVHQFARSVSVEEVKIQLLKVPVKVFSYVGFHPDTEGMAPVSYNIIESRPQDKSRRSNGHNRKECAKKLSRKELIHCISRNKGKCNIDGCNRKGTEHVQYEKLPVCSEI